MEAFVDFEPSDKTKEWLSNLKRFMDENVYPVERDVLEQITTINETGDWTKWVVPPLLAPLKRKAREAGFWNMFLPDEKLGQGLSCLEYAPLAEEMGRCLFGAELFNCNAPDSGNMEVLYHFGSDAQKAEWLTPLLNGEIRSVFAMTEPDVASSDATNMCATIEEDGDNLVLNGRKWWSTGLGHPDAKISIFMGLSNPDNHRYAQHSMVLVPLDTPGVKIERMVTACGEYDAPYGHGEMSYNNVVVPRENVIMALGAGFLIAQGRLGPGRIHHCMRAIGAAERSLELMIKRGMNRVAFKKPLLYLGGNLERVAEARMAIDQARLLTLHAAWKIDKYGVKDSMTEISAIKVVVPNMLQFVADMAIQMHGGAGVSNDFPLAGFAAIARSLRLADGPDEVHRGMVSRLEINKYKDKKAKSEKR